jgi:hypothetical protein
MMMICGLSSVDDSPGSLGDSGLKTMTDFRDRYSNGQLATFYQIVKSETVSFIVVERRRPSPFVMIDLLLRR